MIGYRHDTVVCPSVCDEVQKEILISSALFGHVARLHQDVPAHKALHCHADLSLEHTDFITHLRLG